MSIVKELFESFVRAQAKMVTAMNADLLGFFQLFLVKMRGALFAADKDILSAHDAIFIAHRLDLAFLLAKPGHKKATVRNQRFLRRGTA